MQATVQFFFRCPADLAERFVRAIEKQSPRPSRNALLEHLVQQWVDEQEQNR